jgi:hypothetical protein
VNNLWRNVIFAERLTRGTGAEAFQEARFYREKQIDDGVEQ